MKDAFQFKKFEVKQSNCAMKVCTDACIFGAVIEVGKAKNILDIGAGTGLLSLMVAQKSSAKIDAIEIDENAYLQCRDNFLNSPWCSKLKALHNDIRLYSTITDIKYDIIITNPPFYNNSLLSNKNARNTALHQKDLSFASLIESIDRVIASPGKLYVLLPPREAVDFTLIAERLDYKIQSLSNIFHCKEGKVIRRIIELAKENTKQIIEKDIIIKEKCGTYTEQFEALLRDYYIIF